jgi:hypothetical protein
MKMKNIICPVSPLRVDENIVRFTALWVVLLAGVTVLVPNIYIPIYLVFDFYLRAFTKARFSPLSWISIQFVKTLKLKPHLIDKAPKIFAARIGLSLTVLMAVAALVGFTTLLISVGAVLMLFAFLECGVNFCAGCWVYTYIVLPIYKDK